MNRVLITISFALSLKQQFDYTSAKKLDTVEALFLIPFKKWTGIK
jgi:hypothetical protein